MGQSWGKSLQTVEVKEHISFQFMDTAHTRSLSGRVNKLNGLVSGTFCCNLPTVCSLFISQVIDGKHFDVVFWFWFCSEQNIRMLATIKPGVKSWKLLINYSMTLPYWKTSFQRKLWKEAFLPRYCRGQRGVLSSWKQCSWLESVLTYPISQPSVIYFGNRDLLIEYVLWLTFFPFHS